MKTDWSVENLKSELGRRSEVKGWLVVREHIHRRERYFLNAGGTLATDQDREVHQQEVSAQIFVNLPNKPGRQGEITKKLFTSQPLSPQIDGAIAAALQTDHQAWTLPSRLDEAKIPQLTTVDSEVAEDVEKAIAKLTIEINEAVGRKRPTQFNSAELFVSVHEFERYWSTGLTHRSAQSRLYAEAAFSMTKGGVSDEFMQTRWSVSREDMKVAELFDECSGSAEHIVDVELPKAGRYPVIVDAEVLAQVFSERMGQLSGVSAYQGLPYQAPGDELVPGATGDLITLTLDPSLPYGADTTALSDQGAIQRPLKLVEKNKVLSTALGPQYAQYLGREVTTVRGNLAIEPGTLSHTDLTQQAPLVLEILQFSGLFGDPYSGTFSSEIRLARLYDNVKGTVSYIKGGSLSGSIAENFKRARFTRERVKRAHFESGGSRSGARGYYGPSHALLNDVSVVS